MMFWSMHVYLCMYTYIYNHCINIWVAASQVAEIAGINHHTCPFEKALFRSFIYLKTDWRFLLFSFCYWVTWMSHILEGIRMIVGTLSPFCRFCLHSWIIPLLCTHNPICQFLLLLCFAVFSKIFAHTKVIQLFFYVAF
jgi:hypothetical protein